MSHLAGLPCREPTAPISNLIQNQLYSYVHLQLDTQWRNFTKLYERSYLREIFFTRGGFYERSSYESTFLRNTFIREEFLREESLREESLREEFFHESCFYESNDERSLYERSPLRKDSLRESLRRYFHERSFTRGFLRDLRQNVHDEFRHRGFFPTGITTRGCHSKWRRESQCAKGIFGRMFAIFLRIPSRWKPTM